MTTLSLAMSAAMEVVLLLLFTNQQYVALFILFAFYCQPY